MKESLDIFFPSKYEKVIYADFEYFYFAVRYVHPKGKS